MKDNEEIEREEERAGEPAGAGEIQELPEEEIARLKSGLEAKEREAKENLDRYLRAVADLDNYRKRTQKELQDAKTFANETLIAEILPVLDNFERAFSHIGEDAGGVESIRQGVKLIIDQMFGALKGFGLEEIKALGERFDPGIHHAISEEESAGAEPGTVIKEFQKGYFLKGRLLRPSMVAVARTPAGADK